jgi:hypothetical protein
MDRRDFLSVATGVPGGLMADGAQAGATLDLSQPKDLLMGLVKLRARTDGEPVYWWMRGIHYGVVETTYRPLYGLINGSFQRLRPVGEDRYEVTMLELAYYTDLQTGEALREFRNPYTDEVAIIPDEVFGPNNATITLEGLQPPDDFPLGKLDFEGQLGPAIVQGDDVWIKEDTIVHMTPHDPNMGKFVTNELVAYKGSLDELSDPSSPTAQATLTYNTTFNWRPWMKSGETPGHVTASAIGSKVDSVEAFPSDYLAIAERYHPNVINDPIGVLDGAS